MRKRLLQLIVITVLFPLTLLAQTPRVTGKITGPNGEPLSGASVTVAGTTNGVITDASGNFSISAPANASLLVTSVGFTDQTIALDGRTSLTVQLVEGVSSGLNEVVVTGYTAQRKKDIVGSVAVVDPKALKSIPAGSAMQVLQGQAAGVNVVNSGSPGAPSNIFIRGVTGFANDPLVMIDGIQGNINDVPPNDIESIQVLKDAGAASIYGARGATGVIIITTKKGRSGAPVITYDSYYNLQIPRSGSELNMLSAQQWTDIYKTLDPGSKLFVNGQLADYLYRYVNAQGQTVQGATTAGDPIVDPSLYRFDPRNRFNSYVITQVSKNGQGGDMYDAIFNPALMMNHTLSLSGGSDRANYLLSLGYLNHQGTLTNTFQKRYNMRVNTTFKLRENIRVGENLNIYFQQNPQAPANGNFGPIQQAINQIPIFPIYTIGGDYAGPFTGPGNFALGDWGNSYADVHSVDNNRARSFGMIGNIFAEVDFLKHFTARSMIGGELINLYSQNFQPTRYWTAAGGGDNRLTETSGFTSRLQWTNTLQYRNLLGKHNISVLAGTESVENNNRTLLGQGDRFLSTNYNYLILNNSEALPFRSTSATSNGLFSLIGRLDYAYNDKYLLGLTVRRDGFSEFGPRQKYGVFPALALGWRLSQEEFMKGVSWINDLKIRGSHGVMGFKETVPPGNAYSTYRQDTRFSYYDLNGSNNAIVQGFFPSRNGNASTSWEENVMTNVGFDATIVKNKIDLSVEYYKKRINGLLLQVQAPYTAGEAVSPVSNVGNIENKGWDVTAAYRGVVSRDLQYNFRVNLTTYKNTAVDLVDPGYIDAGIIRHEEGYPISSFFGYQIVNVFQSQDEVNRSPVQQDAAPGRYRYLDADGNDTINAADRVHFGDPNPDFTIGVNLGASYKKLDFSAIIYSSIGNDIYNGQLEYTGSWERGISNRNERVLRAWTPTNTNTNIKKNELSRNFSNSGVNNSDFLENGSFVRLRSLQVGYNLESPRLRSAGLSRIRVYVQGLNLITITQYSGLDPEVLGSGVGFRGIDSGAYVQEKGIVFGLNVGF